MACSLSLLDWLLDQTVRVPEVVTHKRPLLQAVEPSKPDIEAIKLNQRLRKASDLLRKKRERLH